MIAAPRGEDERETRCASPQPTAAQGMNEIVWLVLTSISTYLIINYAVLASLALPPPAKVQVAPRSCREEEDKEDITMTPDSSSPLDYDELGIGNMDSWTDNDVRKAQTCPPCC